METEKTVTTAAPILAHLTQKAIAAHNFTSFWPEKRGEQLISDHSNELIEDMEELKRGGATEEAILNYRERYEKYLTNWLHAKSRCISTMITGPSNFPVRRAEKANRSERNHAQIFCEWRIRAKKAIIRKAQPPKTIQSEMERYKAQLESLRKNHELMKEGNKRIKEAHKKGLDITEYLATTFDIKPHMIEWTMKFGFGLQNNLANIKRVEGRIKELERRATQPSTEKEVNGVKIVDNVEENRVQVIFPGKPAEEIRTFLKRNGFRWAPSNNAWQGYRNRRSQEAAKELITKFFNNENQNQ